MTSPFEIQDQQKLWIKVLDTYEENSEKRFMRLERQQEAIRSDMRQFRDHVTTEFARTNGDIAQLREHVTSEFAQVRERMDGMDARLTGVEGRLTGVEGRLTGVEGRLTGVENQLVTVNAALAEILRRLPQSVN